MARRIRLEGLIGEGAHSQVKLGHDANTFEPVAVKIVDFAEQSEEAYEAELEIARVLPEHRNIPKLLGYFRSKYNGYLVLEYLPFPTLRSHLKTHGPMKEEEASFVLRQLVDVTKHMADHGLAHRDLKSDNLMINPDTLIIKLIDFNLATKLQSIDDEDDSYRGTPVNMAPEVLVKNGGSYRIIPAEIWSIGVVYWECLLGNHPFRSAMSREQLYEQQKAHLYYLNDVSEEAKTILFGLMHLDPNERLSPREAKAVVEALFPSTISFSRRASEGERQRMYTFNRTQSISFTHKRRLSDEEMDLLKRRSFSNTLRF